MLFRYLDIRTNPEYKYDQVLEDINYNFSIISGGTGGIFTGGTISGDTDFLGQLSLSGINILTLFSSWNLWSSSTGVNSIIANNGTGNLASGWGSSILAGTGHTVSGRNSAIIGGGSIIGAADDTVYVPYLNIKNIFSGTPTITLGLDSIGNVVTGTTASVNPTTTYIPINSGGTFVDSFLHQDSNSVIISKILKSSVDSYCNLNLGLHIAELYSQYGGITSYNVSNWIYHTSKLQFDAPTYNFTNITPSRIAVFDGSSNLKPGNIDQTSIITGGTYSAGTTTLFKVGGGTVLITGYSTSNASTFTGGTVTGDTIFTAGLSATSISATSISATTYYGDGSNLTGIVTNSSIARTFMFMGG